MKGQFCFKWRSHAMTEHLHSDALAIMADNSDLVVVDGVVTIDRLGAFGDRTTAASNDRERFEEKAFQQRFLMSITKRGSGQFPFRVEGS